MEDGYLNSERCTAYALPDLKGWKLLGEGSLMFDGDTLTYSSDDGDHIEFDARPLYTVPYGFFGRAAACQGQCDVFFRVRGYASGDKAQSAYRRELQKKETKTGNKNPS